MMRVMMIPGSEGLESATRVDAGDDRSRARGDPAVYGRRWCGLGGTGKRLPLIGISGVLVGGLEAGG